MLLLDQLAHRYGMLPSQVLKVGDSLDITVLDVALTYKQFLEQKHNRDSSFDNKLFDEEQLKAAVERAKSRHEGRQ